MPPNYISVVKKTKWEPPYVKIRVQKVCNVQCKDKEKVTTLIICTPKAIFKIVSFSYLYIDHIIYSKYNKKDKNVIYT